MSTNTELIAEARKVKPHSKENCGDVIWALADALEAAEAVIARAIAEADELLATETVNQEEDNYDAGQVHAAADIKTILTVDRG